ncbi:MAG: DNA polymerase Y family protein, partial [Planctomycetota bacterium]
SMSASMTMRRCVPFLLPLNPTMKRLLSIWLPDWPIQRLKQRWTAEGETLPERPVILWKNDHRRGRTVIACCQSARRCGIRQGLPIAQAVEWINHPRQTLRGETHQPEQPNPSLPSPLVLEHDVVADTVALQQIAEVLQQRVSPLVAIEPIEKRPWSGRWLNEPDTLFCDLSGVTHLFEDEPGVLQATRQCLSDLGWSVKLAIAGNATAAWALAHYHRQDDFQSTDPIIDLQHLPVDALRIETETRHTLGRLGVETIGALLRLPRSGLTSRLGAPLVQRIAEAIGERDTSLSMHHPEVDYVAKHDLEYPTDDSILLGDRIERLSGDLTKQLRDRRRGALRVLCQLDRIDHDPRTFSIGLFAPTQDGEHLAGLLRCSLDSLRLPGMVTRLTLRVMQSGEMRTQQHGLFADGSSDLDPHGVSEKRLSRLVDSLSSRLGADAVLGVRLTDNPLPEKAYRTYRLTDFRTRQALRKLPSRRRASRGKSTPSAKRHVRSPAATDARRRPLQLLRRPIELQPVLAHPDDVKRLHDPVAFRFEREVHRIARHWGPERIESGWWSGPSVRRHYYRVETIGGRVWWVFQDLSNRKWFLHGRFT